MRCCVNAEAVHNAHPSRPKHAHQSQYAFQVRRCLPSPAQLVKRSSRGNADAVACVVRAEIIKFFGPEGLMRNAGLRAVYTNAKIACWHVSIACILFEPSIVPVGVFANPQCSRAQLEHRSTAWRSRYTSTRKWNAT